jgi:sodium/proline symporter
VKEDTTDDYLVAGRGMHPALAALSAVSTWNSGYMFIGFIGFIFLNGYSALWIAVVSTIGQLVAWIWLYKYIQKEGKERNLRSLSSLVSNKTGAPEAKIAAILSVFFLSIYAAAQLTAGGVALKSMLGWSEITGILIGFVLVVAYCYAGGIRASIWTDAAQSCVMIVGSTILCLVALGKVGGLSGLHSALVDIDPNMVNVFPSGLKFGVTLWIAAFFLGGLGVAGQPQVVSRIMTLNSDKDRKQAMVWFFVWQTPFIVLMFLIGLACRAIFPEMLPADAETGLPRLAQSLNPILGGVILASIFAATMSTADSQVLACTAAITDDVKPEWNQDHGKTKKVTLAVAAFATSISLVGQQFPGFGDSVFALVVFAVYGLGGIFVPLVLIRMIGYEPDSKHTISMMIAALLGVLIWTVLGYGEYIFPSVPGMGAAFAVHLGFCWKRDLSEANPFGRYSVPTRKISAIGAVILLAFVGGMEGTYQVFAPNSSSMSDKVSSYSVSGTYSFHEIIDGSEFIEDGESIPIEANSEDSMDSLDGLNIVGVLITIAHQDDETVTGLGCLVADPPQDDTVDASIGYSGLSASDSSTGGFAFQLDWHNSTLVDTTVSNMTKSEIDMMLNGGGLGLGGYELILGVTVQNGGGAGCSSDDTGQDVNYKIELVSLKYTITAV